MPRKSKQPNATEVLKDVLALEVADQILIKSKIDDALAEKKKQLEQQAAELVQQAKEIEKAQ